jgi:hypothetical protein
MQRLFLLIRLENLVTATLLKTVAFGFGTAKLKTGQMSVTLKVRQAQQDHKV